MKNNSLRMPSKPALSIIFSNLSKASEKQQLPDKVKYFNQLSEKYSIPNSGTGDFTNLKNLITEDIKTSYPEIQIEAESLGDRGVLRAIVWGKKVSTLQKSLIDRYQSKGEQLLEGNDFFVCEACGFILMGKEAPALCPVCKAPSSRFSKIK